MGYEAYNSARESQLRTGERQRAEVDQWRQQRTRREAGNALQSGDYDAASNALFQGGDLQGGLAVQTSQRTRQTADRDRQKAAVAAGIAGLRLLPEAERAAAFQQRIAPFLRAEGFSDEQLATVQPENFSNAYLDGLSAQYGGEVQRPQTFNTRRGVVERDPYTGSYEMGFEVEEADPTAPAGYRWTDDNQLEAIPGGPADPRVVSTRAAAGRAPPRARASSGGAARPSGRPAAPSRKPWERF